MKHPDTTASDEDTASRLLSAARGGSSESLGQLMETCRGYLLAISQREMKMDLRAKVSPSDLVQETFAEGFRSLASFKGSSPDQFTAWLRGILHNKLAHAHRRHVQAARRSLLREERQVPRSSLIGPAGLLLDEETPSQAAMQREESQTLRTAMFRLPEHYRQLIELRNFDLLSFEDISVVMHRPTPALRALWIRAMQRLKRELEGFDDR